jgi:hypothetical protein
VLGYQVGTRLSGRAAEILEVRPGETKDLGDLKITK